MMSDKKKMFKGISERSYSGGEGRVKKNTERKVDKKKEFRGRRMKKKKVKEARIRGGVGCRSEAVHACDGRFKILIQRKDIY